MPFAIIRHRHAYVNMRKLHVKRSSFLIEPANQSIATFVGAKNVIQGMDLVYSQTKSPRPSTKSTVLETLGEIISILSIFIIGWIAYVVL